MKHRSSPPIRTLALGLALLAAPALAAAPQVGDEVPELVLTALDGGQRTLSERDAATMLIFFRGAW